MAHDDEPEREEDNHEEARDEMVKPIFEKYKRVWRGNKCTCLLSAPAQLACLESPERRLIVLKSGKKAKFYLADEIANHGGFPCAVLPCKKASKYAHCHDDDCCKNAKSKGERKGIFDFR